jgi:hypothetical protein
MQQMICCDNKNRYFHYGFEQFQMFSCGILMKTSSKLPLSETISFVHNSRIYSTLSIWKKAAWVYNGKSGT